MEQLPKSILIVGGGVIGIEWASMLHDFGVEVTVIEYADRILPTEDEEISKEMQSLLKKKGIKIVTNAKVLARNIANQDNGVTISAEINGETKSLQQKKFLFLLEDKRILKTLD